jgi:hypothetical protein
MLALLSATFPDATAVDLTQSAIDLCEALRPLTNELNETNAAGGAAHHNRSDSCTLDTLDERLEAHHQHQRRGTVDTYSRKDHVMGDVQNGPLAQINFGTGSFGNYESLGEHARTILMRSFDTAQRLSPYHSLSTVFRNRVLCMPTGCTF